MLCPICKQPVEREGNPFRPFCSDRCKLIDLDNWLEGRYCAPGRPLAEEEDSAGKASTETEGKRE